MDSSFRTGKSTWRQQRYAPTCFDPVRFGIRPDSYDDDLTGILVGGVTEGGSAEKAGVQAGDILVGWNENTVEDVRGWMELLREHDPGDVVAITVVRDGKQVQLKARLEGRDTEG